MNEDIFNHLLDVESQAANMLFEAQTEADDKVANVKKEIEKEFKSFHDEIVQEQEERFENEKKKIDVSLKESIQEYEKELESKAIDYKSFSFAIDDFFFKNEKVNL